MNLALANALYAGGQGSGCKGQNCGRPKTAEPEQKMPRGRQSLQRIDAEIKQAARGRQVIIMEYRPGDSTETKTYQVEPYSYRGDKFFGFDRTAGSIKAFQMMNIVRVQQTKEQYKPKWKVELAASRQSMEEELIWLTRLQ